MVGHGGLSWGDLGLTWRALGAILGHLGASWSPQGFSESVVGATVRGLGCPGEGREG